MEMRLLYSVVCLPLIGSSQRYECVSLFELCLFLPENSLTRPTSSLWSIAEMDLEVVPILTIDLCSELVVDQVRSRILRWRSSSKKLAQEFPETSLAGLEFRRLYSEQALAELDHLASVQVRASPRSGVHLYTKRPPGRTRVFHWTA